MPAATSHAPSFVFWLSHGPGNARSRTRPIAQLEFNKYWHDDAWIEKNILKSTEFDYSTIDELKLFDGTHPKVMLKRIQEKNWKFDYDLSLNKLSPKERIKSILNKYLGLDFSYKNYRIR